MCKMKQVYSIGLICCLWNSHLESQIVISDTGLQLQVGSQYDALHCQRLLMLNWNLSCIVTLVFLQEVNQQCSMMRRRIVNLPLVIYM